jgi:NAD(P)-dependent dehydrogenase (short-subunit alcohol dehydrogenase family)
VIAYLSEHEDAGFTKEYITQMGGKCLLVPGDLTVKAHCESLVHTTLQTFGRLDILVNNAGVQYYQERLEDISDEQFDHTMKSNVYSMFYLTRAALPYLDKGASIINTTSITTFMGEPGLIDYVMTKGAQVGFTRSLAKNLSDRQIRVNEVAPGYFWTPLQPATGWPDERIVAFGADAPMGRAGEPADIAPTYVYLASEDARYVTGQTLHVNGGVYFG